MEEMNISTKDEISLIIDSYKRINDIGIKMTNYKFFFETIIKIVIISIIFIIK